MRLVLGERGRPYDVVAGLASTLEQADDGAEQLAVVAEAVASAFGISYVCLEVDRAHRERLVATHGTAPKYAGKDMINPASVVLSGVMMLRYLGWIEAADLIEQGLERTIQQKKVTYDLARQMQGATELKTSQFADAVISNM